ncbi:hypothetical protein V8C26DRAFT_235817 [Trichoderma gracile]
MITYMDLDGRCLPLPSFCCLPVRLPTSTSVAQARPRSTSCLRFRAGCARRASAYSRNSVEDVQVEFGVVGRTSPYLFLAQASSRLPSLSYLTWPSGPQATHHYRSVLGQNSREGALSRATPLHIRTDRCPYWSYHYAPRLEPPHEPRASGFDESVLCRPISEVLAGRRAVSLINPCNSSLPAMSHHLRLKAFRKLVDISGPQIQQIQTGLCSPCTGVEPSSKGLFLTQSFTYERRIRHQPFSTETCPTSMQSVKRFRAQYQGRLRN